MAEHPPKPTTPVVSELETSIQAVLGNQLEGLYLYGSLVLGDFDQRVSDIDLLAVTDTGVNDDKLAALRRMHEQLVRRRPDWKDRVEVAYIARSVLKKFKYERGEVVRISPGEPIHRTPVLPHWLMDLYSVQEHGVALSGLPALDVIPPISVDEFKEAVRDGVAEWREWVKESKREGLQAYARLAMCRSLYACAQGEQASKRRAAVWTMDRYPQWSSVVKQAVQWRQEQSDVVNEDAFSDTVTLIDFTFDNTRDDASPLGRTDPDLAL